jgi:hypothetical protein
MELERMQALKEGLWEGRAGTLEQSGNGRALASSMSLLSSSVALTATGGIVMNPETDGVGINMSSEHPQSLRLRNNSDKLPPLAGFVSKIYYRFKHLICVCALFAG